MYFVTDIKVVEGKGAPAPTGYTKIDVDTNRGAGGKYLYICYKLEDNPQEAIDDIMILVGKNPRVPFGYTLVSVDLNKGAGGEYLYICYRRNTLGCMSICRLTMSQGALSSILDGCVDIPVSLNEGTGGECLWLGFERAGSPSEWMKYCSDDTLVQYLAIPGTHDTLTYAEPKGFISQIASCYAQCQNLNLKTQLSAGVRYIDIRTGTELEGRHGSMVEYDVHMDDVFDAIQDFLTAHPTEVVFMRFKTDHGEKNEAYTNKVKALCDKFSNIIWKCQNMDILPTLGKVRGKLVIFDELGIENGTYAQGIGIRFADPKFFHIQDDYDAPNEDKKFREIMELQQKEFPGTFKLNHVSATGFWAGVLLPGTYIPADYANYLNPRVCEELAFNYDRTGIMIFDFIDPYIANRIYIRNFPANKTPYDSYLPRYERR